MKRQISSNIVRSIIAQGYYAQVFDFINVGTAALESIQ